MSDRVPTRVTIALESGARLEVVADVGGVRLTIEHGNHPTLAALLTTHESSVLESALQHTRYASDALKRSAMSNSSFPWLFGK